MKQISILHNSAMSFASDAETARLRGDFEAARNLFEKAFEYERQAALSVDSGLEPTRSSFLRSAASLAIDCNKFYEAEQRIGLGLSENGPSEIRDELRDLYETITFHRHLEVRGEQLAEGELQFVLAGKSVGFGIVPADECIPRITTVESLLLRTAERKSGVPFREKGRPKKSIEEGMPLYLSAPRAASFAVTIRLGQPSEKQLRLFDSDGEVLREFLECISLFSSASREKLAARINDRAYYRNFVQQARRLAPDGDRISTVGFTSSYGGEMTRILMRGAPSLVWTEKSTSINRNVITIVGVLTEAAKKEASNTIGLREEDGKVRTVHVPKGLMADIVRPLWDRMVKVKVRQRNNVLLLEDISPQDEQSNS